MNLVTFFRLIRWKNLLLITYVFFLIKFLLFPSLNTATKLNILQFLELWLSVVLITAAGYIINDISDINTDKINKLDTIIMGKYLSITNAKKWYIGIDLIGILIGLIFSLSVNNPLIIFVFVGTSLLLYWYAKHLKSRLFIGNFLVAFLITFSIILLAILDINYQVKSLNQIDTIIIIYTLSIFSFFINLSREIVKDIEDIKGDYALNMKTLPIIFGINRILKLSTILTLIPVFILLLIILNLDVYYIFLTSYLTVTCLIPLIYVSFKLWKLKSYKKIHNLSLLLKIIMFLGINSILIISLIKK